MSAMGGALLLDQPAHRADRERLVAFIAEPGPLVIEVGFDHGMRILANARRWPEVRWLGLEIRRRRVEAAAPHAPPNCLLFRGDARTVLSRWLPDGRVDRVEILFPTPATRPNHVLVTPAFVEDLARVLAPDGVVHVATDLPTLFASIGASFAAWRSAPHPPAGAELSRRERVCRRDGIAVSRATWARATA